MVVRPEETNSTYYNLDHQGGRITAIPENLCMFPNLVILNLANNFIHQLENISCILELNQLNVQNNRITSIKSNTFSTMEHLRILDISYNHMQIIEPDTFLTSDGLIYSVSANQQTLKEVDVTNIFGYGLFCLRNLSRVSLDLVNEKNVSIFADNSSVIGPGTIVISSIQNQQLYNFTDIGLDFPDFRKTVKASVEFSSLSFHCDCSIVPLLKEVGVPAVLKFWPALLDGVTCSSPDTLKGLVLDQYFTNETLDRLTCDITINCPYNCTCTDLQNQEKVLVNCTGIWLTSLPDYMPTGFWNNRDLEVLLDGNRINTVEKKEWLERTQIISLAGNPFDKIDTAEINHLPDDAEIDLSELVLKSLPRSIQKKDLNKISFTGTSVVCNCTNTWIGDWIRSYRANKKLWCNVNGHFIFAEHVSSSILNCTDEEHVSPFVLLGTLLSGLVVVILASLLLHYFRFEIIIIKRRFTRNKKPETDPFLYKAFISFDTNDDCVLNWVIRDKEHKHFHETISERLTKERYTYFIRHTDILPGDNIEEATSQKARQCETFLIIYSENYLENEMCRLEFDIIWKQYRANQNKKIILIEFDTSNKKFATLDRRLKALLRASNPLRFEARNDRVIDRLLRKLVERTSLADQVRPACPRQDINIQNKSQRQFRLSPQSISTDRIIRQRHNPVMSFYEGAHALDIELHAENHISGLDISDEDSRTETKTDATKTNTLTDSNLVCSPLPGISPVNREVKNGGEFKFRPNILSPSLIKLTLDKQTQRRKDLVLKPDCLENGLATENVIYSCYNMPSRIQYCSSTANKMNLRSTHLHKAANILANKNTESKHTVSEHRIQVSTRYCKELLNKRKQSLANTSVKHQGPFTETMPGCSNSETSRSLDSGNKRSFTPVNV